MLDLFRSNIIQKKKIYHCFIDFAKALDCVAHSKLWTIHNEMVIPGHITCLLRNLYAGQEAIDRTGYGAADWFQIEKGVHPSCISSPYFMQNKSYKMLGWMNHKLE